MQMPGNALLKFFRAFFINCTNINRCSLKNLILPLVFFLLLIGNSRAQDLLSVDWQKIVCANGYIDHIEEILTDKHGNTYTLGSFPNEASILGQHVTSNYGACFLLKQNTKGEKIFLKTFGNSRVNLAEGDIEFAANGDIILSLDFRDSFYFDGKILVHGDVYRFNTIILKTDSNFNLKWFKTFQKNTVHYITNLILDKEDNIYCTFSFMDQLAIDSYTFYNDVEHRSNVFVKFDSAGKVQWARHFQEAGIGFGMLGSFCDTCTDELLLIGGADNELVIDNVLYENHHHIESPFYMCILGLNGEVELMRRIDKRINGISGLQMYNNRLFFAGDYIDRIFIGELNRKGDMIGLKNFKTEKQCYVTDLQISPLYGYVVSGCYNYSFSLQHAQRTLPDEYDRGSFIASLDDSLELNDCKFIDGRYYNLRKILIDSNIITGAALFRGNCSFSNASIFGWNDDISVFQTTDLKPLVRFLPDSLPKPPELESDPAETTPLFVHVYPNPFINKVNIKFNRPSEVSTIHITDALGRLITGIKMHSVTANEYYIDTANLPAGFYFLKFNAGQSDYTYKLIKVDK